MARQAVQAAMPQACLCPAGEGASIPCWSWLAACIATVAPEPASTGIAPEADAPASRSSATTTANMPPPTICRHLRMSPVLIVVIGLSGSRETVTEPGQASLSDPCLRILQLPATGRSSIILPKGAACSAFGFRKTGLDFRMGAPERCVPNPADALAGPVPLPAAPKVGTRG